MEASDLLTGFQQKHLDNDKHDASQPFSQFERTKSNQTVTDTLASATWARLHRLVQGAWLFPLETLGIGFSCLRGRKEWLKFALWDLTLAGVFNNDTHTLHAFHEEWKQCVPDDDTTKATI